MPPVTIIILGLVLLAIALRQLLPITVPIWVIMFCGGIATLILRDISWQHALNAINMDVIGYLFGVFVIAEGLEQSGYLEQLTDKLFYKSKTGYHALLIVVFGLGLGTTLFMNDTVAIIGTPIILQLCRRQPALMTPLLLALAYSITIGSVMSPIGNPQNLLIAIKGGFDQPFVSFIQYLAIPTIINLVLTAGLLSLFYHKELKKPVEHIAPARIQDKRTALCGRIAVWLLLILILIKIMMGFLHTDYDLDFSWIALLSAAPILIGSQRRLPILAKLDWGTLIFFASLFVLMQSVWDSGYLQHMIHVSHIDVTKIPAILIISTLLSQLLSNVPLVALYLPLLKHAAVPLTHYLVLAAGSTVAGNLFIFGAASNIIIVQNVEKRQISGFSFWEFTRVGLWVTIINLGVYAIFMMPFSHS